MPASLTIRPPVTDEERFAAADIMAASSPWTVYGRNREGTYKQITHPTAQPFVALLENKVVGITITAVEVPLIRGYIWALAVHPDHRNQSIGSALLKQAENHIFAHSPNVFICVTSFNTDAQRLYARHGYTQVGLLENYVLEGVHEHLLRKTKGPTSTYYGPAQATRES